MKIALIIPTRSETEREEFLSFSMVQIKRQTRQPDSIILMNEPAVPGVVDLTRRYREGVEKARQAGCDLALCWEDDDYYRPDYIERISSQWDKRNRPDLIGYDTTLYYHLYSQKYLEIKHPGRASMMSTGISTKAQIDYPADDYPYTDYHIWTRHQGPKATISSPEYLSVGIKHGQGMTGGSAHPGDWKGYNKQDSDFVFLSTLIDEESMHFYKYKAGKSKYLIYGNSFGKSPLLTIVTRIMKDKRPEGLKRNLESIRAQDSVNYEHLFIVDPIGYGRKQANKSFELVSYPAKGKYIYLLDDDDFLTDPGFVRMIGSVSETSPEVIFFKMKILTGDGDQIYPKPESWIDSPKRGRIGGSCFAVRKDIFKKHIHKFNAESFGDFHFIESVYQNTKSHIWIDRIVAETGRVSRGKSE